MSSYLGPNRTHGIRATYNAGCRCDACRMAEADYRAAYRTSERAAAQARKEKNQ